MLLGSSWPAPVRCFESLESTSDWLKAHREAPAWTVAWAATQTRGRGRLGQAWQSPRGNIALSVVLPADEGLALGLVPLAAGVAVAEALAQWGARPRLKWPNDVLIDERKVAGLLVEAASSGRTTDTLVLGIGVNLEHAPELGEGAAQAAIAVREVAAPPSLAGAGVAVLRQVALWYDAVRHEPEAVRRVWRMHSVDWWGQRVEWLVDARPRRGRLAELRDDGALWLELDDGRREAVLAGEIRRLRRPGE